ncbi:type II secretion system GspH family protein [Desulfobotulus sp. H1]|uniref:Type II secretion system GspH family protein n=1 Tax=Desulfobotulus pelophilus TaxID=2823377 RepID=A0ABT3N9F5_9BACT|nr:type II secretion system protein [Desulfobotulus pelophilus]MCW7754065.1 type II secretion system GspH family protein [Desulfobotulus pelophilus]
MGGNSRGFTLMEVLIVVGIMGLMAAMVLPFGGMAREAERERATLAAMDALEEALLGHSQLVDPLDKGRIIGGYVGDMGTWPDLFQPGAKDGLPGDTRGEFTKNRFQWKDFTKVTDPKAPSLGQPRGLWTFPPGSADTRWKGPYLREPRGKTKSLARHYASSQKDYEDMDELDREYFHLLQAGEQLRDGWGQAFRFFISPGPKESDSDANALFWIISMGPDGMATLPDNIEIYDPDASHNQDNIVRKFPKHQWQDIMEKQSRISTITQRLIFITEDRLDSAAKAIVGDAPAGANTGYTADLLDWPQLWNRACKNDEGHTVSCTGSVSGDWQNLFKDGSGEKAFTYGQPRGLWDQTALEGIMRGSHGLTESYFGVGWRHGYIPAPHGSTETLQDAWNRPLHFFKIKENGKDHLMVLSGGPSGSFCITDNDNCLHMTDPENWTKSFSLKKNGTCTDDSPCYDPEHDLNRDNRIRILRMQDWTPGFLKLTIRFHAEEGACPGSGDEKIRCRIYGIKGKKERDPWDEIGKWTWTEGENGTKGSCTSAFSFSDTDDSPLASGGRYLVCWKGNDNPLEPCPSENCPTRIFSVYASPGRMVDRELVIKDF